MARHYYRTNIPFGAQLLWWIFCGICILVYGCYDVVFKAPERNEQIHAQRQWDIEHFNGWRLEQNSYASPNDVEHGLYFDKLELKSCTTVGYPGYPLCPSQAYYVDGKPQASPPR